MPVILSKNFEGKAPDDFGSFVKARAKECVRTGAYDFVYIVPTRRRVRELERELVRDVAFGKLPVYTLELFAQQVYRALPRRKQIITPSMQGMIVSRVISKNDLKFFRFASARPGSRRGIAPAGTIKRIVDQIGYLKENGITPQDYKLLISTATPPEKLKLEEFLSIYSAYENELGSSLTDAAGLFSSLNSGMSDEILERVCGTSKAFLIEGFYNFKRPELEFLKKLTARKDYSFLVRLDCSESNENLFKTMLGTVSELKIRGFKTSEVRNRPEAASVTREFLEAHLFADSPPKKKLDLKEKAFVVGVRDALREVEYVAEKIKEIVRKDPAQELDRICVASYLPQDYSRIFREVFPRYEIPVNITDRYTLESSPVVNAILSFVDVRLGDYERVSLLRAVTNRMVTVSRKHSSNEAGSILLTAAALCRFERGLKTFRSEIDSKLAVLERTNEDDDADDFGDASRSILTLKNAGEILDSVEQILKPLKREMTADEFRAGVRSLVSGLGIYRNITGLDAGGVLTEIVERDARALSAFLDVVDEVAAGEKTAEALPIEEWTQDLRAALALTRFNIRQRYGFGVYVTALEEMRGLEFDHVFILGLNEGALPNRYTPEIFLPLSSQRENRETQPYLQRHLFYQASSSFEKSLHLLHPIQNEDVRLMRSSFIRDFLAAVDATEVDETAETNATVNIYSVQQLLEADAAGLRGIESESDKLPPNLARCKEAENARYSGDHESEFNGKVSREALADPRTGYFSGRVFSSAQIQSLSRCGFQFFARRILQISETPEIDTSLSPIERGNVLHRILYKFYASLAGAGKLANANDELKLLLQIGRETLDGLGIHHELFDVEREEILGNQNLPGTLELFLKKVQARLTEYKFVPELFEYEFGIGDKEPANIGGIPIRGKIDRLDSSPDGLIVLDYKTSSKMASHRDVVDEKISPQLLIYIAAVADMVRRGELKLKPAGAAFLSLNRGLLLRDDDRSEPISFIVSDREGELRYNMSYDSTHPTRGTEDYPKTMDALVADTVEFVGSKIESAKSGYFNLTEFPYEKVCLFCPYSESCRIALGEGDRESV